MGPAILAQTGASPSCPDDAGSSLWQPVHSPQNSPVCTFSLALTASCTVDASGAVGAVLAATGSQLSPGLEPAMPKFSRLGQPCISLCSGESWGGTPWLILYVMFGTCQWYQPQLLIAEYVSSIK